MMKALIFGGGGQDAFYLENLLKSVKIETQVFSRSQGNIRVDVSDFDLVQRVLKAYMPDYIFHLAANSTTKHEALFENSSTIGSGTVNILEAVKRFCPQAIVFITGSGLQFKNQGLPISEKCEFEANSPYSLARIYSVYAARYYRSLGVKSYVGYLFHHESPLRKENHISQKIVIAVNRIRNGSQEVIEIGDLNVEKEWTFAGDIVKGIFTLVNQDDVFECTIGSGKAYSIARWLECCFRVVGKDWREHVRTKADYRSEYKKLVSDPTTIHSLGWSAEMNIDNLAEYMLTQQAKTLHIL